MQVSTTTLPTKEYNALKAENAKLQGQIDMLVQKFNHLHVNSHDYTDSCKECGLDLRNPIHFVNWVEVE